MDLFFHSLILSSALSNILVNLPNKFKNYIYYIYLLPEILNDYISDLLLSAHIFNLSFYVFNHIFILVLYYSPDLKKKIQSSFGFIVTSVATCYWYLTLFPDVYTLKSYMNKTSILCSYTDVFKVEENFDTCSFSRNIYHIQTYVHIFNM